MVGGLNVYECGILLVLFVCSVCLFVRACLCVRVGLYMPACVGACLFDHVEMQKRSVL